jgi:glycosyltransferase involved in cell wall biosynthesis
MRILFLSPSGGLGGAERCLVDLVASIRAYDSSVEVGVVAGSDGPLLPQLESLGALVVRLPLAQGLATVGDSGLAGGTLRAAASTGRRLALGAIHAARYAARLRATMRRFAPSVVHSNGIKMHLLAAAAGSPAPLVWHLRDFIGQRPLVPVGLQALRWRADAGIAISQAVGDDARRVLARPDVHVVYDAIDTDVFAPAGRIAPLDALAGGPAAPEGCVRVGLVATYARWKGHEVLLEAARHLTAYPDAAHVVFYIVGGPIYDTTASQYTPEELRALASRLGVAQRVRFVPFQARVDEVFRALDVVVHASSRREPFGRTIAEGMATGKPVIVANGSGAAELFADSRDAVGVPPGDPEALARAVRRIALDPAERARLGRVGRATAVARFSRTRLAREVFDVYRAAGERTRRTAGAAV